VWGVGRWTARARGRGSGDDGGGSGGKRRQGESAAEVGEERDVDALGDDGAGEELQGGEGFALDAVAAKRRDEAAG